MPEYPSADALTRRLAELERRVRDLESSSRLGNSALIEGAFLIRKDDGTEVARFGQLTDGTVGVDVKAGKISGAVISGGTVKTQNLIVTDAAGNELPLGSSLFGIVSAADGAISVQESLTVPNWTAGGATSPVFTTTPTGRVLIIASVNAVMVGVGDNVYAGVRIRNGADTGTVREANLNPGDLNAIIPNFGQYFAASIQGVLTLSPSTTYRARLVYGAKGDPANNPDCTVRGSSLIVWPL